MSLNEKTKQKISVLAKPYSLFIPANSVIVSLQGSIGKVAITNYPCYIDRTILYFYDYKININKHYWAYIIKNKFYIEQEIAPGSIIKTITKEELSKFYLDITSYEEQTKIGELFKNLDELITLTKKKHEKLKNIKNALLNKMFC